MADYDFDVLVIGAGPGGYVAAIRAAQLGLKTACVESRETLGGTCLNVGCIPSKALLHASELYEEAHSGAMAKFGVQLGKVSIDVATMQAEKAKAVGELTGGIDYLFKKNKVTWIKGHAAFTAADTVVLRQAQDERAGKAIRARNIVIATGSSVTPLPGVVVDNVAGVVVDSTGALALDKVPGHMVVIGGGVIGMELGSVWKRLGASVTVVEYLDQILPGMDDDIRKEANKLFKKQGFTIRTSTKVTGAAVKGKKASVTVEPASGGESSSGLSHSQASAAEVLSADVVLVAIGRKPNTDGLALDKAGLSLNARGQIEVGHDFATSVPGIWAIGDVTPGPMLAHKAEDEGIAVAENIAGQTGIVNHDVIPSVVYTFPEIAGVGLTEEAAKAAGHAVKVGKFPMMANSRAKTNREGEGLVKVIADAGTDRVLGVWIIASVAGTMIAQAAQAMEFGATSEDIAYTCHAHPTHSEALKEAAMAVTGKAIHI
ncbi:MAG: dihydrolipoyl dehydrogenase [Sphingopyxis sp.]